MDKKKKLSLNASLWTMAITFGLFALGIGMLTQPAPDGFFSIGLSKASFLKSVIDWAWGIPGGIVSLLLGVATPFGMYAIRSKHTSEPGAP